MEFLMNRTWPSVIVTFTPPGWLLVAGTDQDEQGPPALAAEVFQKRNAVRELLGRYMMLHGRKQPIRDAEELARIAEQLGRGFEARGFLTIAVLQEPGRKDLREKLRTFDSRLQR
jgi:hypothetical protein